MESCPHESQLITGGVDLAAQSRAEGTVSGVSSSCAKVANARVIAQVDQE